MGAGSGWGVHEGPGITALGLAAARAVETGRADRLAADPYAQALATGTRAVVPFPTCWPGPGEAVGDRDALFLHGSRYIGARTRFYDDRLLAAAGAGVRQVVLLGAGLDTRAYRLDWPEGTAVYELDQPGVLAYKHQVLHGLRARPTCRRAAVGADLLGEWSPALAAAGHDPRRPTAWVAEGLLAYLDGLGQAALLADVDELSAPGSTLALDRLASEAGAAEAVRKLTERSGIAMDELLDLDGFPVAPWLGGVGWRVEEETAEFVAAGYGRDLTDPFRPGPSDVVPPWLATVFLTARRD